MRLKKACGIILPKMKFKHNRQQTICGRRQYDDHDGRDTSEEFVCQFQCNNPQKFQLNIPHVKVDSHVLIMRHGGLYVTQGGMDGDSEFKVAGDEYFRDFTIVWN